MCGAEVPDETAIPLLTRIIGDNFALLAFLLRICSGLPTGGRMLGWDDWTMTITVLLAVTPTVFSVLCKSTHLALVTTL
jgi:hypothetical protein